MKHKLEISRMSGLTRLRCEPCKFYAALVDGATEAETEKAIKETALAHLTAADPNDPLALSLAEGRLRYRSARAEITKLLKRARNKPSPVKYEPIDPAPRQAFTGGFSEMRAKRMKRRTRKARPQSRGERQ